MRRIVPKNAVLVPEDAARVFSGIIFDVYHWEQQMFDGTKQTFELLKRPDTVVVIGVVGDSLVAIREDQPNKFGTYGFPSGRVEVSDIDQAAAARREMLEETGYSFETLKLVEVKQPFSKIDWVVATFIATGATKHESSADTAGEKITVELLSFDEVRALALNDVGMFGGSKKLFDSALTLEGLSALPEFEGRTVLI